MKPSLFQILIIFQIVLLISVFCLEKHTKTSHRQQQRHRNKNVGQPANDVDHYANKIFRETPQGRDKYENFVEESVYIVDTKLNPTKEQLKDPQYKLVNLKLNRNALFYTNQDPSYRGVLGSIQLAEIITQEDKPEQGQCCRAIGDNSANKILIGGDLLEAQCFKITAQYDIWSICFTSLQKVQAFKKKLLINIITSYLEKQGIFNVNFVNDVQTLKPSFSWNDQASWEGLCKKGTAQSPIQIMKGQSLSYKGMRLKFQLQTHSVLESTNQTQSKHAQAIYDGQQFSILGNFGQIIHLVNTRFRDFNVNKLQFKFKSEHTIDNEQFDCEILIHAVSEVGTKAIASVLLKIDEEDLTEDNKFLDDLDFDLWELKKDQPFPLEKQPNLLNLLDSVLQKDNYAQQFYWYMGSETEPACEEGVFRYILATPIYVPRAQLNVLKTKTYNNVKEPNGNIKIPIPLAAQRQLYYHEEKACPKVQQVFTPSNPEEKKECPETQLKYIKATSEVPSYAYVDSDIKTGDIKEGVRLEIIQPDQLPAGVGKTIRENAKILAQKNCRDKRIQQKQSDLNNKKKNYKKKYEKKDPKKEEENVEYEKVKDNVYDDLPTDVVTKIERH